MRASLNLKDFHELTGCDAELEHGLFVMFLHSAEECLAVLQTSWRDGMENTWQRQAHALKGLCLNLGAEYLGQLCEEAQENVRAAPEKKQRLLSAIQAEFENVRGALKGM